MDLTVPFLILQGQQVLDIPDSPIQIIPNPFTTMHRTLRILTALLATAIVCPAALTSHPISFDSRVIIGGSYRTNTLLDTYAPSTTHNSAFLAVVTVDGNAGLGDTPTFGGEEMTLLAEQFTTRIWGILPSSTAAQEFRLSTTYGDRSDAQMFTYGLITGIDTTDFGNQKKALGASATDSPRAITASEALRDLDATDYVLSSFVLNSAFGINSPTPSSPLANLAFYTGTNLGNNTMAVSGGIVGQDGDYTAGIEFGPTGGRWDSREFTNGAQVAFSAAKQKPRPVPDSTTGLLGILVGSMALAARKWRR